MRHLRLGACAERKLVAEKMMQRNILKHLTSHLRRAVKIPAQTPGNHAHGKRIDIASISLKRRIRKFLCLTIITLGKQQPRTKRERSRAKHRRIGSKPKTFASRQPVSRRDKRKRVKVVGFSIVCIHGHRSAHKIASLIETTLRNIQPCQSVERRSETRFLFNRETQRLFGGDGVEALPFAQLLNALYIASIGRIPIEILRHLKRSRLDVFVRIETLKRFFVAHHAPSLAENVSSAGREGRKLERSTPKARVRLLEASSRLKFDIRSIGIGEQTFPNRTLPRKSPHPNLAPVLLVESAFVKSASLVLWPPNSEISVVTVHDVHRTMVFVKPGDVVLAVEREVVPVLDRPRMRLAAMTDPILSREEIARSVSAEERRVHPLVVGLRKIRSIEPDGLGLKTIVAILQSNLHLPESAAKPFRAADKTTYRSIGIGSHEVVDWRGSVRLMPHLAEIKFDSARRPRTAHGDVAKLGDIVEIDEINSGNLVNCAPNFSADLRRNRNFELITLKRHRLPVTRRGFRLVAIETVIRIIIRASLWHGIGIMEHIGGKRHLPGRYGSGENRRAAKQRKHYINSFIHAAIFPRTSSISEFVNMRLPLGAGFIEVRSGSR